MFFIDFKLKLLSFESFIYNDPIMGIDPCIFIYEIPVLLRHILFFIFSFQFLNFF